ncbi:MAG: DNA-3-methyladenine glycosylase [Flavobacteriales bacterium]
MKNIDLSAYNSLPESFYQRNDVLQIAEELIGKKIISIVDDRVVEVIIVETEAYNGVHDRACHAFGGKRTPRNEVMYQQGGVAYIYLCYGIHHLFNFVTSEEGDPKAVLLRGVIPVSGYESVLERRGKNKMTHRIGIGPGAAAQTLGFHTSMSGKSLLDPTWIQVQESEFHYADLSITRLPRIGVDYAGADAQLPYRFVWEGFEKVLSGS